jgi:hypothetical protein
VKLDANGEIPAPFCWERHNFNPFSIMAGNKLQIQKKGWLVDSEGNIIDEKTGKVKFDKKQLTKEGNLPKLFNFNGKRFDIHDVIGEFDKEANGDLCFQEDPNSGQLKDKSGRPVN